MTKQKTHKQAERRRRSDEDDDDNNAGAKKVSKERGKICGSGRGRDRVRGRNRVRGMNESESNE